MKRTYITSLNLDEQLAKKAKKELTLGYLNLEDGMFEQAKLNFELALEFDKTCADAFWGLMLVKFQLKDEDELYANPIKYKSAIYLPECQKALDYAQENQRKVFTNILDRIFKINEGDNY